MRIFTSFGGENLSLLVISIFIIEYNYLKPKWEILSVQSNSKFRY